MYMTWDLLLKCVLSNGEGRQGHRHLELSATHSSKLQESRILKMRAASQRRGHRSWDFKDDNKKPEAGAEELQANALTPADTQREKGTWHGGKWKVTLRYSGDRSGLPKGVGLSLLSFYRESSTHDLTPAQLPCRVLWNARVSPSSLLTNWCKAS